ncbi:MAG: hypothetical protein JXR83_13310 [Deltaproteobacteria bacterium]|nr:hypothetical protein [Deltaproteobacteria bacterium]
MLRARGQRAEEAAIGEQYLMVRLSSGEARRREHALARLEELIEQRDLGEVEATLDLPRDETLIMIATKARTEIELEEIWIPRLQQLLESLGLAKLAAVEIPIEDDEDEEKWNEFDISAAEAAVAPDEEEEAAHEEAALVTRELDPDEFERTPVTNVAGWRDDAAWAEDEDEDDVPPRGRRR